MNARVDAKKKALDATVIDHGYERDGGQQYRELSIKDQGFFKNSRKIEFSFKQKKLLGF